MSGKKAACRQAATPKGNEGHSVGTRKGTAPRFIEKYSNGKTTAGKIKHTDSHY
jgi:hypothetical protein